MVRNSVTILVGEQEDDTCFLWQRLCVLRIRLPIGWSRLGSANLTHHVEIIAFIVDLS
jgi:hypothetical protein